MTDLFRLYNITHLYSKNTSQKHFCYAHVSCTFYYIENLNKYFIFLIHIIIFIPASHPCHHLSYELIILVILYLVANNLCHLFYLTCKLSLSANTSLDPSISNNSSYSNNKSVLE